ncbi:hypothetical protein SNOG_03452 [Parastagonospora nodorum SN15]|uniref:Uncharacterized protein n=1 Tax=Phaeosphaeria nodorum (strain SN15 / ATCC MYA-4574 / FGSC 10173) TaxID=321614 RepID=Q0UXR2_PHANO|nr:hypothetical protein SNOG_03452 [Parastagonospora nodorum SN15]EAT88657.1 hypothetical protein SNOG_03452 [Parastagonospora nodorum SN15]
MNQKPRAGCEQVQRASFTFPTVQRYTRRVMYIGPDGGSDRSVVPQPPTSASFLSPCTPQVTILTSTSAARPATFFAHLRTSVSASRVRDCNRTLCTVCAFVVIHISTTASHRPRYGTTALERPAACLSLGIEESRRRREWPTVAVRYVKLSLARNLGSITSARPSFLTTLHSTILLSGSYLPRSELRIPTTAE